MTNQILPVVTQDERKVREVIERAVFTLHTEPIDAYFEFYAKDAVWMIPSSYRDISFEEAKSFYGFTGKFRFDQKLTINEVRVADDWAFARISLEGYLRPRGEANVAPLRSISRHMWILERQPDGNWLITRDIWNNPRSIRD